MYIEEPTVAKFFPGRAFSFPVSSIFLSYYIQHPASLCSAAAILQVADAGLDTPFAKSFWMNLCG